MNIAIVTGASSGLGTEFVKEAVKMYPNLDEIWLIARRAERLEKLSESITTVKCVVLPLDLSTDEGYKALFEKLSEAKPNVKLLINNAGYGKLANFSETDYSLQIGMVDLNCRGLTAVANICLKFMSRGSQIINTCSIAAFAPNTRLTVYSSTKAYVMSFTKGLHEELKPLGINCCCVCPGPMKTEFLSVADIAEGTSHVFDILPYSNPTLVARNTLKAAAKGRCVYTPKMLFKFYRVLAKILPHSLVMKWCKA